MLSGMCIWCQKVFLYYRKDSGRFCSLGCYNAHRAQAKRRCLAQRPCTICGKTIERPSKPDQRFCFKTCQGIWEQKENLQKPCKYCSALFFGKPNVVARRKYCSKECADKDRVGQTFWELPKIAKVCGHCEKPFEVIQARKNRQYCSKACADTAKRGRYVGEANWNWKPKVNLICEWCQAEFQLNAGSVYRDGRQRAKYCSQECVGAASTARQGGRQSGLERRVVELLDKRGYEYIPQMKVGRYSVDFGFPKSRNVVELQGDYWHSGEKAQKRDAKKAAYLKAHGYCLITIWEHEFYADPEGWIDEILSRIDFEVL